MLTDALAVLDARELNIVCSVNNNLRPYAPVLSHCHLIQGTMRAINQLAVEYLSQSHARFCQLRRRFEHSSG